MFRQKRPQGKSSAEKFELAVWKESDVTIVLKVKVVIAKQAVHRKEWHLESRCKSFDAEQVWPTVLNDTGSF
jgi:hypothetical protein